MKRSTGLIAASVVWLGLGPAAGTPRAGLVEDLLTRPVTQMDQGIARLHIELVPVLTALQADGDVIWHGESRRIRIVVEHRLTDSRMHPRTWAETAAADVRARFEVDPETGRLTEPWDRSPRLEQLFRTATGPSPPAAELGALIELYIRVHGVISLSPNWYRGDLLDDDLFIVAGTLD